VSPLGAGVGGVGAGAVGGALVAGVVVSLPSVLAAGGVVALAGSRSLPPGSAQFVAGVARSLVAAGASLVVGCAVGADAAVLSSGVPPSALRVLAAFGPGGAGAWVGSAVSAVRAFAAAGGAVVWWAGGGPAVPLRARLAARTRAVVTEASAGLVVFFGSPASRGSVLAAQLAAARGLPVVAFPLRFPPAQLPALSVGSWVPAGGADVWTGALVWVPEVVQGSLF
jgi:predicted Rossmann fold nucleotide-binding protein DprA/Smf involved in DNA uptake